MNTHRVNPNGDDQSRWVTGTDHRRSRGLWHRSLQCLLIGVFVVGACGADETSMPAAPTFLTSKGSSMWMTVGERRFAVTLANSDAARALAARIPLTLEMIELNGNEKHADLPHSLPTSASKPGILQNGDLMLYGNNTVVIFYRRFRSSYAYTRLGRVDEPGELAEALGRGSVRVVFSARSAADES